MEIMARESGRGEEATVMIINFFLYVSMNESNLNL